MKKAYDMRWQNLSLVFDENASFSFYAPSKALLILIIFFKIFIDNQMRFQKKYISPTLRLIWKKKFGT